MSASVADIRNFFSAYARDFNGLCEATMFQVTDRFGSPANPRTFPTARAAGLASVPLSAINEDHIGWYAFWGPPTGGAAGHTALIVPQRKFLMGSTHCTDMIGGKSKNVGFISIDDYTKSGFLGIANNSGGRTIDIVPETGLPASGAKDWAYWAPNGTGKVARVQRALKARNRFSGVADDSDDPQTRQGIQYTLNASGIFKGVIDGDIQRGGCYGMQDYAIKFGSAKIKRDGILGPLTWDGFALGLERP